MSQRFTLGDANHTSVPQFGRVSSDTIGSVLDRGHAAAWMEGRSGDSISLERADEVIATALAWDAKKSGRE